MDGWVIDVCVYFTLKIDDDDDDEDEDDDIDLDADNNVADGHEWDQQTSSRDINIVSHVDGKQTFGYFIIC